MMGAALHGKVPAAASAARIRLYSGSRCVEVPLHDDEWGCFGLPPGQYRVEYISLRTILSREVVLVAGRELEVDFDRRA